MRMVCLTQISRYAYQYYPGGGFSLGSSHFYLEFLITMLDLLKEAGYRAPAIFSLEYTLVPDQAYPVQVSLCPAKTTPLLSDQISCFLWAVNKTVYVFAETAHREEHLSVVKISYETHTNTKILLNRSTKLCPHTKISASITTHLR